MYSVKEAWASSILPSSDDVDHHSLDDHDNKTACRGCNPNGNRGGVGHAGGDCQGVSPVISLLIFAGKGTIANVGFGNVSFNPNRFDQQRANPANMEGDDSPEVQVGLGSRPGALPQVILDPISDTVDGIGVIGTDLDPLLGPALGNEA